MDKKIKQSMLELVRSNVESHGYHCYLVEGGDGLPRFSYTIGLFDKIGFEVVFAGGYFYSSSEVLDIIHRIARRICADGVFEPLALNVGLSETTLRVDSFWVDELLLGVTSYYGGKAIPCMQLVPDSEHITVDVPDMSRSLDECVNSSWKWLKAPWRYSVSFSSTAVTNLAALRGEPITEAVRWEESEWELFAGAGPDVVEKDIRTIPLGVLLGVDPTLEEVTYLNIGKGLWRGADSEWVTWN